MSQIPAFELSHVLRDDAQVHLEGLQEVGIDVFADEFMRFCAGEDQVVLLEQGCDVSACDLAGGLQLVLQLAQTLCGQPELSLETHAVSPPRQSPVFKGAHLDTVYIPGSHNERRFVSDGWRRLSENR